MTEKKAGSSTQRKSLHVLYTGVVYPKVITGGDQLFIDIAPRMPEDIDITIIAPHFTKDYWKGIKKKNITYKFLPPNRFEFKGNPIAIFLSYSIRARQVYKILKSENVQTIYSCSDIAYADIWPAFLMRRNKSIKWLSRVYHVLLPPKSRQGNPLVNMVAFCLQRLSFWLMKKRSTTIFALNPKLRKEMLDLGFPARTLKVLGAGIDFKKIDEFKPTKKYPYDVVVLGRITPVKGIFDAVKIWDKVHATNPKLKLAWIGGGSDNFRNQLIEQLEARGLTDSFELLGFIEKKEVYNILKSAKIFLCPDHENGWGLAVCEAMSAGLPVISYNLDIFGSVYKKGYKSVPLYNTEKFGQAIIDLLGDKKRMKQMSRDARAQVKQFDHQEVVDTLVKYI